MSSKYIPKDFEQKWIETWEKEQVYKTPQASQDRPKQYILDMFPYPSGAGLHVGHVRGYTASDILARYHRMKGDVVLHPMGWDAFGLPAENAAIKAKKNPIDMVPDNIANFRRQMKSLGFSYDWNREFSTTDPNYYRWTQWLFIQFFKMGLLYKKETPIFYCPSCKTGLAQEEVLSNGTHERCGNKVEERTLPQWIFRITTYADRLLADLSGLDWPKGILEMQKNWIGRKEGAQVRFNLTDIAGQEDEKHVVDVFTTRIDTIYGVTFLAIAPGLAQKWLDFGWKASEEVVSYITSHQSMLSINEEKEGDTTKGIFAGIHAINPINGEKVPVWIADYVLMDVGTGALMGVPAHDQRDFEFAKSHDLPIRRVISGPVEEKPADELLKASEDEGKLVNSGDHNGLESTDARKKFIKILSVQKKAHESVTYHLRDWIFSRQRYWGEPIPMVYCQKCAEKGDSWFDTEGGKEFQKSYQNISKVDQTIKENLKGWFPVEEKKLPVELPYVQSYEPSETGESPLAAIEEFVNTTCPNCGSGALRETDTMPNWAGSCWYFLYFAQDGSLNRNFSSSELASRSAVGTGHSSLPPTKSVVAPHSLVQTSTFGKDFDFHAEKFANWLPVDWYIGGAEHAVLHLLYARFWVKALSDLGLVTITEPFLRLRNVGMVLAQDGRKMSKSLGNVINPDDVVNEFGADVLRVYEMFMAPFSQDVAWSTQSVQGSYRFLKRIWQIYTNNANLANDINEEDSKLVAELQNTIQQITDDITNVKFNTSISTLMKFLNEWESPEGRKLHKDNAKVLLQLLAPFAPFITEELWRSVIGETQSIHLSSWPQKFTVKAVKRDYSIPIQVNGRVRDIIIVSQDELAQSAVEARALASEKVKKYIDTKPYKVIYVQDKIINFILH